MVDHERNALLKEVFDRLPAMVFVVDGEVRIQDYNHAAANLLQAERQTVLKQRAGTILHCVNSVAAQQECGTTPFCPDCVIREAVTAACRDNRTVRRRKRMELVSKNSERQLLYALITASPLTYNKRSLALLQIEDISEIAELQRLVPICLSCQKVRDDQASWIRLEAYFKNCWDLNFSHGYCPDCLDREMSRLGAARPGSAGTPQP